MPHTAGVAPVVAAQVRPCVASVSLTSSIDFLPKFGIAASSFSVFDDQVADRLDADALEAVVRADAELELLDREVLHPVRERRLGGRAAVAAAAASPKPSILLDVGEDRELADQDLGRLADRLARVDRAVGRDVEARACRSRCAGRRGRPRRRTRRGAPARRSSRSGSRRSCAPGPRLQLGRDVAAAAADRQRHLELALVGEVGDLEVRVEDLELGRRLDVARP